MLSRGLYDLWARDVGGGVLGIADNAGGVATPGGRRPDLVKALFCLFTPMTPTDPTSCYYEQRAGHWRVYQATQRRGHAWQALWPGWYVASWRHAATLQNDVEARPYGANTV